MNIGYSGKEPSYRTIPDSQYLIHISDILFVLSGIKEVNDVTIRYRVGIKYLGNQSVIEELSLCLFHDLIAESVA
jgi:hypothetical protein